MSNINSKSFEELIEEIQEYESRVKKTNNKFEGFEGIDLETQIKTKITGLSFDQLITEVQKIEKIIATKSYNVEMLSEMSSLEEIQKNPKNENFDNILEKMEQAKKIKKEIKKPLIKKAIIEEKIDQKIEKISREDQINKIDEINSMRDYVLISYAREYIKELYDKFNSGEISPEEFRYQTRKKMAFNKGINEELIQDRIHKEKNPFEELGQSERG